MFTVIVQNQLPDSNRFDVAVGTPKDLINLLIVLENSSSATAYKVVDSDAGVLKDMKGYGVGELTKMVEKFTWNELIKY